MDCSMSSYYEKLLATGEVKCIDEEVPFEIPQGWEWCRMGCIGDWGAGATPAKGNPDYYGGSILWLRTGELNNGIVYDSEIKITDKALQECSLRMNKIGDVLIAMYGATIGKVAIVGKELTTNQACCACTPFGIYNYYLFFFLMGSQIDFIKKGEGGAQPNISREKLISHLMPIPPLAEQYRIVEKIQYLLPLVEKYSNSQILQNKLNSEIKDKLRKSILQEAIQGKLVPQIAEEGTAQDLLEQIKTEKQKLVKEGKLKKSALNDSVIFRGDDNKYYELIDNSPVCIDEFLPFQIPETWVWCKVKDLLEIQTGASFKKEQANANKKGIRILRGGNILPNKYIFKDDDIFVSDEFVNANTILKKNCIITPAVTSLENIGKMAVIEKDYNNVSAGGFVFIISPYIQDFNHSLLLAYFFQSPFLIEAMRGITKKSGAAFYNLGKERLKELYLPLPPMVEQGRIVGKINEVLSSIGRSLAIVLYVLTRKYHLGFRPHGVGVG